MEQVIDKAVYLEWLRQDCGYMDVREIAGNRWVAIAQFMFTHAIVQGHIGNVAEIDDRWCYEDYRAAKAALDQWDGTGEPEGWHQHPATGRRRPDGNPAEEYIAW